MTAQRLEAFLGIGQRRAQHQREARFQHRVITARRIAQFFQLPQRDGALGQGFVDEVIDSAPLDTFQRGFPAVAGVARAAADAYAIARLIQAGCRHP